MTYCVLQDLRDRYGDQELIQLTDRDGLGVIDEAVIGRAISDADGEIDSYLGGRFDLPLTTVSKAVTRVACDIARYYLYDDKATEAVIRRYNDAVKFIRAVGKGDIDVGVDAAGEAQESDNLVTIESGGNVFNRKDNGFI